MNEVDPASLLERASRVRESNPGLAAELARQAAALVPEPSAQLGEAFLLLGMSLEMAGEHEEALVALDRAESAFSQVSESVGVGRALRTKGASFRSLSLYPQALDVLAESAAILETAGSTFHLGHTLQNLAVVLMELELYDQAIEASRRAADCARRTPDEIAGGLPFILNNLALAHLRKATSPRWPSWKRQTELAAALQTVEAALALVPRQSTRISAALLSTKGEVLTDTEDYGGAELALARAWDEAQALGSPPLKAKVERRRAELALRRGNPRTALQHADAAESLLMGSANRNELAMIWDIRSRAYDHLGRAREAFSWLHRSISAREAVRTEALRREDRLT